MVFDVAFITVNFNTCALTADLIRFFRETELPFSHCLVIVDNASTDGSRSLLEQAANDRVFYIQANNNLGYGRGMNRGLEAVTSRYACIMNTDLILNQDALVTLWDFFEDTPNAGIASPVIIGSNGRIQGFLFLPGILSMYSEVIAKIRSKSWKLKVERSQRPLLVPGVMGAFFMIRRSLFDKTPLFDEDFFFYYEDTELAHRYWIQGLACYVLPNTSIIHLGGQSTSVAGGKLFQQSRHIYISKCYGDLHANILQRLDRAKLYSKFLKYRLLTCFINSKSLRSKFDYYSRLIDADIFRV